MERKIGEIFEYNGEWYQCISDTTDDNCNNCFFQKSCSNITGDCSSIARSDGKSVAFKKLEKVGEPYEYFVQGMGIIMVQEYILASANYIWEYSQDVVVMDCQNGKVAIEIKQNKEDMEDLDKIKVRDYTKVEELNVMEEKKLNLKPFDIQKAREGKPVCTRDGRNARVLCYDFKQNEEYPILVAVENKDGKECALLYSNDGISEMYKSSNNELAMFPEKKEGWININKDAGLFKSKEEAERNCTKDYVPVRVEFEI